MPPVTTALIAANVVAFLLQTAAPSLAVPFALWPLHASSYGAGVGFAPWQLVTYAFLHGSVMHLGFNMLALYMFGGAVEAVFGSRRYLAYYFASVLAAAITQLLMASLTGEIYPTIGASGGVFGLLLAYAIYFPNNRIMLIFPPIPMPARTFVVLYAVLELVLGMTSTESNVAHFAHLGGMVGGYIMLRVWRMRTTLWRRR